MNSLPEKLTPVFGGGFARPLSAPSTDVAEVIMTATGRLSLRKKGFIFFFSPKTCLIVDVGRIRVIYAMLFVDLVWVWFHRGQRGVREQRRFGATGPSTQLLIRYYGQHYN